MAFSHQERWLEYVLSKIAEIKGTGSFDSPLGKRNLKQADTEIDKLISRVSELENTVRSQRDTIESQRDEITRLWDKVNSL